MGGMARERLTIDDLGLAVGFAGAGVLAGLICITPLSFTHFFGPACAIIAGPCFGAAIGTLLGHRWAWILLGLLASVAFITLVILAAGYSARMYS